MKVVVLTTDTLHHTYFVEEINKRFPIAAIILETKGLKAPFPTGHPIEQERDEYELQAWFDGEKPAIDNFAQQTVSFPTVNCPEPIALIQELAPDVTVVFGTGKIGKPFIEACPGHLINLHGGDPQKYRGLDTHLWAIYHNDFDSVVTALHKIAPRLDTGDLIAMKKLPLKDDMSMAALRQVNSEVCVSLVAEALEECQNSGTITSCPQTDVGRYYSFMPDVLKDICVKKFHRFTGFQK